MDSTTRDPARRTTRTRTTGARTVALVAAVTVTSLAALAPGALAPASAADQAGPDGTPSAVSPTGAAVTWARLSKTTFWAWEAVRLDIGWAVPDGASPGDTFRVELPPELRPTSTLGFDLLSSDGSPVASAVWEGRTAVVTLGDYVAGLSDLRGEVFFDVTWNGRDLGTAPTTRVVSLTGGDVTVTMLGDAQDVPVDGYAGTWGYWQRPDQGTVDADRAVGWEIRFPSRTEGFAGPVTVTYDLGPEQALDCSSLTLRSKTGWGRGTPEHDVLATSPERVRVVRCDARGLVLELDEIRPDENLLGGVTADLLSTGPAEPTAILNLAHSTESRRIVARLVRTSGGGLGSGTTPTVPGTPTGTTPPVAPAPPSSPDPVPPVPPATPGTPDPAPLPEQQPVPEPAPSPTGPVPDVPDRPVVPSPPTPRPSPTTPAGRETLSPSLTSTATSGGGSVAPADEPVGNTEAGTLPGATRQDPRPLAETGTSSGEQTATALALAGVGALAAGGAARRRQRDRPR